MKLLIDENLSPRIAPALSDVYPGSKHIENCGLISATDEEIWQYASRENFAILTKDSDFTELCAIRGAPPKVIWLRAGNCTTNEAVRTMLETAESVHRFMQSVSESCLVLTPANKMPVRGASL